MEFPIPVSWHIYIELPRLVGDARGQGTTRNTINLVHVAYLSTEEGLTYVKWQN